MIKAKRISNALLIGLMAAFFSFSMVQIGEAAPGEGELDPVVSEVVEMLSAEVEEEIILQWLEATARRPVDVGSQGLIALTEAGASSELIGRLLDLVAAGSPPAPAASPDSPASVPAAPIERRSVPEAPAAGDEQAYRAARAETPGDVLFLLSYKKIVTQEPEPDSPPSEPWTVYAYLDGELVAWGTDSLAGEPVRANRLLTPGRHVVRVTQERHIRRGEKWVHESRVVPTFIAFEVAPGEEMEVELKFHGRWMYRDSRGPLSYAVRRGNQTLVEEGPTGGDPSEWKPVCEDVEANFPDKDKVPRLYRQEMARCVLWSSLWQGAGEETSRTELLASMSESDFRPPFR